MSFNGVSFSIAAHAAWAPGVETGAAWLEWAQGERAIAGSSEPALKAMSPMLRRRSSLLGKMALEVAYQCLGQRTDVPTVFCSRHGEATRSVAMLTDLAQVVPLSPTAFGMSVHNAAGGMFSIARADRASNIALAAGDSGVEHAVIEASGLLADGAPAVLLVVYDCPIPEMFSAFQDGNQPAHAWAWLMEPATIDASARSGAVVSLAWSTAADPESDDHAITGLPGSLQVLRFHLREDSQLQRRDRQRNWLWTRNA
jgi:hypothetical protein